MTTFGERKKSRLKHATRVVRQTELTRMFFWSSQNGHQRKSDQDPGYQVHRGQIHISLKSNLSFRSILLEKHFDVSTPSTLKEKEAFKQIFSTY